MQVTLNFFNTDYLPDDLEEVLVLVNDEADYSFCIAYLKNGKWLYDDGFTLGMPVISWRYLKVAREKVNGVF